MEMTWKCGICRERQPGERLLEHIRLMHPDVDTEPETWPDGEAVITEDPDDFFD